MRVLRNHLIDRLGLTKEDATEYIYRVTVRERVYMIPTKLQGIFVQRLISESEYFNLTWAYENLKLRRLIERLEKNPWSRRL